MTRPDTGHGEKPMSDLPATAAGRWRRVGIVAAVPAWIAGVALAFTFGPYAVGIVLLFAPILLAQLFAIVVVFALIAEWIWDGPMPPAEGRGGRCVG